MYETLLLRSARLFAMPSFLDGMASALDLGGTLMEYNQSVAPREADIAALRSDWLAVGDDIRQAFQAFEHEDRGQFK